MARGGVVVEGVAPDLHRTRSGEPTPLRIIGGFNTNLNGPLGIALEP